MAEGFASSWRDPQEGVAQVSLAGILAPIAISLLRVSLAATHPFAVRAEAASRDVIAAVEDLPEAERETWGRVAYVWAFYEAGWFTDPKGSNDDSQACGILQIHTPEKWLPGATCKAVREDRVLGFRAGIALMRLLRDKCGSLRGAMVAYSTDGACHDYAVPIVTRRLKLAGVQ